MANIHSRAIKDIDSVSENKNLGTKDILKNNLVISDINSKDELNKTPSEKGSKKGEKEKGGLTDYELNDLDYSQALELDNRNFLHIQ